MLFSVCFLILGQFTSAVVLPRQDLVTTSSPSQISLSTSAAVLSRQGEVTPLSPSQVSAYKPYTYFASTGYCNPNKTIKWSCGANCDANPGFLPIAAGGDGSVTQFWFVGYDPTLNTVVVSHQGTNSSDIIPLIINAFSFPAPLNQILFPNINPSIEVHAGFQSVHAIVAPSILAAVQVGLLAHPKSTVTLAGHSLGGAIALIDLLYLSLHLPSSMIFKYVGYGVPRVGNPEFVSYLDDHFPDITHINNKKDPVPIVPGLFMGFKHPHGEVHIQDSGAWDSCPGNDNPSKLCSTGAVKNIFDGDIRDHGGPYDDVKMGCRY